MDDSSLTPDDELVIRNALLAERERGVANPLLPADVDLDGDGRVDAFGLDDAGNVVIVPGVDLTATMFESTGNDQVGAPDLELLTDVEMGGDSDG